MGGWVVLDQGPVEVGGFLGGLQGLALLAVVVQWTARCFSDIACLGFQAAFVKFRSSRSTSFGVR